MCKELLFFTSEASLHEVSLQHVVSYFITSEALPPLQNPSALGPAAAAAPPASAASASAPPASAASASQPALYRAIPEKLRTSGVPLNPGRTASGQSIMDVKEVSPAPAGDQWLYRVLTATETPNNLRPVPARFSQEPAKGFRMELVRAVALTLVLFLLVGRVYRRYSVKYMLYFIGIDIGISIGIGAGTGIRDSPNLPSEPRDSPTPPLRAQAITELRFRAQAITELPLRAHLLGHAIY